MPSGGVRDIAQLREVQRLSQQEGMNLAGSKRILELLRRGFADPSTALVVWRPRS